MKYRIANSDEDLGEHPLERLLETFPNEAGTQKVHVLINGGWLPLWPWLEKQRLERAAAKAARAAEASGPRKFRAPVIVSMLRVLSVVALLLALVSIFGPFPAVAPALVGSAVSLWIAFIVIELLARIEFNTRR